MGNLLYWECNAGISGDMAVAALIDAGASEEALTAALASLPVEGFEVRVSRVKKAGLDACDFDVVLDAAHENHDHDMAYLYGPEAPEGEHVHDYGAAADHAHARDHGAAAGHVHDHADSHAHNHEHAPHEHRSLRDILAIIDGASLTPGAREWAHRIFGTIAEAEAQAHGVPADEVHFHEVGAVDSIVDVVAAAVCLDDLGIEEAVVTELCEGKGTVRCQHGIMPVPVPAVVNIACAARIPLRILDVRGELVTPTGAAIAAATRTRGALPERFVVKRVGLGAGKRPYPETSGILRAMIIEEA